MSATVTLFELYTIGIHIFPVTQISACFNFYNNNSQVILNEQKHSNVFTGSGVNMITR